MEENNSTQLLAIGLLEQFSSLKALEAMLETLLLKQSELQEHKLKEINLKSDDEQINEISEMMKKMNIYRLKLRSIRCDMLYIAQRIQILKKKTISIQDFKVEEKAEKVRRYDFEEGLIAKKQNH